MKGLGFKSVVVLAFLALATTLFLPAASARVKIKAMPRGPLSARDSAWIRMVSDPTLILLPPKDTIAAADTAKAREMARKAYLDSVETARRIADSLMMRQDSLIRAQQIADSIRIARQDSIDRAAALLDELVHKGEDYSAMYYFAKAYESFAKAEALCTDPEFKAAIAENRIAAMVKLLDRCNNVSGMASGFRVQKIAAYIQETLDYVYPLMDRTRHAFPEYADALFLIRYHMRSVIETARHLLRAAL